MKKILLSVFGIGLGLMASAQPYWNPTQQNVGFMAQSRGVNFIDVVDKNVVWVTAYDGDGSAGHVNTNILEYSHTSDGGLNWTAGSFTDDTATWQIAHLSAVSDLQAYVLMFNKVSGAGSKLYRTFDGGISWEDNTPYSASAFPDVIHFFDSNNGFTMGDPVNNEFEIYTTDNQGFTWTAVPGANIPAPLSGEYGIIEAMGAYGDTVWFGTNKSRVYKSVDRGLNWTVADLAATIGAGITITNLQFESATTGMAFISNTTSSGIIKTTDGGATWSIVTALGGATRFITSRNGLAHVPMSNPSRYFVTSANLTTGAGTLYTEDYGTTWVTVDSAVQHSGSAWADLYNGWSGSFTQFNAGVSTEGLFVWQAFPTNIGAGWTGETVSTFPNPTTEEFTVSFGIQKHANIMLTLSDMAGRVVLEQKYDNFNGKFEKVLSLRDLANGVYFLHIKAGEETAIQKIVKQ